MYPHLPHRPLIALTFALSLPLTAASHGQTTQPAAPDPLGLPPVSEQLGDPESADVTIVGHIVEPKRLAATDERIASLGLPEGFRISVFARGLERPRMIAVADDGSIYISSREAGTCVLLRDDDHDGTPDADPVVVARRPHLHGLAVSPDGSTLYLTTITEVFTAPRQPDGTLGDLTRIIDDLPDGGQHPNRTLAFGPDGLLYLSVGSTANATVETSPESASIVRIDPKNYEREVFASGLRNTIGFGWHPETGEMYGADHGIDWLGDNEQKEEFNHIQQGHDYGWPFIYADGKFNPQDNPPKGTTMRELAERSTDPVLLYTAHSAPLQMTFYNPPEGAEHTFPAEYVGNAFIVMRGSWNRKPPSGYEVVRVRFDEKGKPVEMRPFVTGFLVEEAEGKYSHFARLAGCAMLRDGSLLIGDDTNGVLYRVMPSE